MFYRPIILSLLLLFGCTMPTCAVKGRPTDKQALKRRGLYKTKFTKKEASTRKNKKIRKGAIAIVVVALGLFIAFILNNYTEDVKDIKDTDVETGTCGICYEDDKIGYHFCSCTFFSCGPCTQGALTRELKKLSEDVDTDYCPQCRQKYPSWLKAKILDPKMITNKTYVLYIAKQCIERIPERKKEHDKKKSEVTNI